MNRQRTDLVTATRPDPIPVYPFTVEWTELQRRHRRQFLWRAAEFVDELEYVVRVLGRNGPVNVTVER